MNLTQLEAYKFRNLQARSVPEYPRRQFDTERVYTKDLADILIKWKTEYDRLHPKNPHGLRMTTDLTISAKEEMSRLTGLDLRTLFRITSCETVSTSFYTADMILTRLEMEHRLHDGSLRRFRRNR